MDLVSLAMVKILFFTTMAFLVSFALTPLLTHFLYKYKLGKKVRDDLIRTPIFSKLHQHKTGTPTMGGILIWGTTALLAVFFWFFSKKLNVFPEQLNFLTRRETWLPLGALLASALVGLVDDIVDVRRTGPQTGGLRLWHRVLIYTAIALIAAYWFYFKLEWTVFYIPIVGAVEIGWWTVPIFIFVIVATSFSVNETDGLDGLAGGVLLCSFTAYTAIALALGRYNLATFCAVISGALLAFLWFNIHPARFIMGDTGSMSLGVTLGIVAMLTNTVWILPIIGFVLVIESASVLAQWTSKGLRHGKKIFLSAPIHHHFEAIGWPEPKVVMRFWIVSGVLAVLGLVLFLIERAFAG